jgi:hypothetical protein
MSQSDKAQVIPFTPEQVAQLRELAARRHVPVATLIQIIVGEYLRAARRRGRPAQQHLPFSAEIGRLVLKVNDAIDALQSAVKKRNPPPVRHRTPKQHM